MDFDRYMLEQTRIHGYRDEDIYAELSLHLNIRKSTDADIQLYKIKKIVKL